VNEDRPIGPTISNKKCRPVNLVSGNIKFMGIFAGFPWAGASNDSGVVEDGDFWRFMWLLLRKRPR